MPRAARVVALGAGADEADAGDEGDAGDAAPGRPAHLPGLDGLRGLAVAAVVAYHLGYLRGGFVGVDLFFVLSGFLISRLLVAEREATGRISLRGFWARRARRLLPAMLLTVAAVAVAARQVLPAWRLAGVRADALATVAYVANWRLVASGQSYFSGDASPLRHAWSLAIEEQFYVLWPLLAAAILATLPRWRRGAFAVAAALVAAASASWMWVAAGRGYDADRLYFGTDTRIFAMAIGAVAALGFDPLRRLVRGSDGTRAGRPGDVVGLAGLAGVAWASVVADNAAEAMYRGGFLAVAVAAAAAVVGAGWGGSLLGWLRLAPLRWLGGRSYGIYLFSWPTQVLLQERFPLWGRHQVAAVTVALTLVLAEASFALVERPVLAGRWPLQLRDRAGGRDRPALGRGRVLRPAALATAVAVTVGVLWWSGRGAEPEPDYLAVDDEEVIDAALATGGFSGVGETTTTAPEPTPTTSPVEDEPIDPGDRPPFDPTATEVVRGPSRDPGSVFGRPLRVVVFGDSVAWSFGRVAAGDLHVPVELSPRAIIGCGIMPVEDRWQAPDGSWYPYREGCANQAEAERLGLGSGGDVVLLWLGAWEVYDQQQADGTELRVGDEDYGDALRDRLQTRIDAARAHGMPTVLPLVPCFGRDAGPVHTPFRTDLDRLAWVNDQIRRVAARNPGWVRLIEPAEVLCEGGEAITEVDGLPLRQDGAHFTVPAAAWFWDTYLAAALAEAFPPAAPAGPGAGASGGG